MIDILSMRCILLAYKGLVEQLSEDRRLAALWKMGLVTLKKGGDNALRAVSPPVDYVHCDEKECRQQIQL